MFQCTGPGNTKAEVFRLCSTVTQQLIRLMRPDIFAYPGAPWLRARSRGVVTPGKSGCGCQGMPVVDKAARPYALTLLTNTGRTRAALPHGCPADDNSGRASIPSGHPGAPGALAGPDCHIVAAASGRGLRQWFRGLFGGSRAESVYAPPGRYALGHHHGSPSQYDAAADATNRANLTRVNLISFPFHSPVPI